MTRALAALAPALLLAACGTGLSGSTPTVDAARHDTRPRPDRFVLHLPDGFELPDSAARVVDVGRSLDVYSPGMISCGSTHCSIPSQECCVDSAGNGSCQPSGSCCPTVITCEGARDCPASNVCCGYATSGSTVTVDCESSCPTTLTEYQVCYTSAECPSADPYCCVETYNGGSARLCVSANNGACY
jgi:hypothetical protein